MRILMDFKCNCGFEGELFCNSEHRVANCPTCHEELEALKSYGSGFVLEPFSGDFPSALRRWEKGHS